jgi:thiosulfate dehydrogenase [quinone] large subunit
MINPNHANGSPWSSQIRDEDLESTQINNSSRKEKLMSAQTMNPSESQVPEPNIARLLFADTRLAPLWLIIRVYLGYLWLVAGWEKLVDPSGVWVGSKAGAAVAGFAQGAMQQTAGEHAQVTGWYASFLKNVVVPNAALFSYLVTFGEILVGIALILGLFTGIAAFFGGFMNASYIFAGVAGANPLMFILATWLVLAWRVAGYWGFDRWVLPRLGVPGSPGTMFRGRHARAEGSSTT